MKFQDIIFDGCSEELKLQSNKTHDAYKLFIEKDLLYDETIQILELVKAQREALRLAFVREEKAYHKLINIENPKPAFDPNLQNQEDAEGDKG